MMLLRARALAAFRKAVASDMRRVYAICRLLYTRRAATALPRRAAADAGDMKMPPTRCHADDIFADDSYFDAA